jgi:hypothetical protein
MVRPKLILTACVLVLGLAGPLSAQSLGIRAGVSADPDQFFLGGHVETRPLVESLTFRPNLEVGFGDDVTLVAANLEFVYSVPIRQQPWRLYFGGGPAANFYSDRGQGDGGSDVGGGFNILIGAQHSRGLFTELKVGTIDSPDIKFAVGYVLQ